MTNNGEGRKPQFAIALAAAVNNRPEGVEGPDSWTKAHRVRFELPQSITADLDGTCRALLRHLRNYTARSAGQHLRAWRKQWQTS